MRLATISDRTLDEYDLTRAEARQEARAGQLWAASRTRIAVAPTAEAARWMLGGEAVERVTCSALPERLLAYLGELARDRALRRREGRPRGAWQAARVRWDPALARLEIWFDSSA